MIVEAFYIAGMLWLTLMLVLLVSATIAIPVFAALRWWLDR